jgi:tRNA 2-thiouridine synthesizing protein A
MPLLKLKQQLNRMQPGECIGVETTDAGSLRDFDTFCRQAQHGILEQSSVDEADGTVYRFLIRKFSPSNAGT